MADPIQGAGGDAIRKLGQTGGDLASQKEGPAKAGPSKFDEVMKQKGATPADEIEATKQVLQTDVKTQINQVSEADRAKLQAEFDTRIAPASQPEQVRYFAVRIRESKETFLRMKSQAPGVEGGAWKDKMVERLDEFGVEYGNLESALDKMSSGHKFSNQELLSIQMQAHRIAQSTEILSKAVEHSVGGMKTIFQTSV